MKKLGFGIIAIFLFLALTGAAPDEQSFTGEIMDSKCANLGGHAEMMKEHEILHTDKECTLECQKGGARLVLFNPFTKLTYQLDDQNKSEQFAGTNVSVSGTLDDSRKTIHVSNITAVPET